MRIPFAVPAVLAAAILAGGCVFVPKDYARLDEARSADSAVLSDASVARYAPIELRQAREALERASIARDTLQDPAVVDHLSYVARQRFAIARAAAMAARRPTLVGQRESPRDAGRQYMCCPPLMAMFAPVRNAASSEAR
jgi:hypothetical protein